MSDILLIVMVTVIAAFLPGWWDAALAFPKTCRRCRLLRVEAIDVGCPCAWARGAESHDG